MWLLPGLKLGVAAVETELEYAQILLQCASKHMQPMTASVSGNRHGSMGRRHSPDLPVFYWNPRRSALQLIILWLMPMAGALLHASAAGLSPVDFNRDVRPILSDNCFRCHGPDRDLRKAKLRLDVREVALEKGAIVPGKPEESELVKRIFATDPDDVMPPPKMHKPLSIAQKETLRKWIASGAEYASHWSYIAPRRPELPPVKGEGWVRNPLDNFILQALEAKAIQPSPEADKRSLLRRLKLDLLGLPPTPEEVRAFLDDTSPHAYEKQVDLWLESPHFGERMAVPWLDTVRYADTVGYHGDQNQNIFPYRDYVINSFNRNKPFDQFTLEQLAGDLLPEAGAEQRIATGFNRLNMVTREGGAQPKEYLAKYAADRVRTVATTWLGSTLACAECHDHKFDPFKTQDFYAMEAFFADVQQWGVYNDYKYTPNPDLKGWSNDHPFPPEVEVESEYLQRRQVQLEKKISALISETAAKAMSNPKAKAAFNQWQKESAAFLKQHPSGWTMPLPIVTLSQAGSKTRAEKPQPAKKAPTASAKPEEAAAEPKVENELEKSDQKEAPETLSPAEGGFIVEADQSIVITNKVSTNILVRLQPGSGRLAAVRLELLPHQKHHGSLLRGAAKTTTVKLAANLQKPGESAETKLAFREAEADLKEPRYANGSEVLGVKDGWKTSAKHWDQPQTGVWLLNEAVRITGGDTLILRITGGALGCLRVSVSPFAPPHPLATNWSALVRSTLAGRKAASNPLVQEMYLAGTAWNAPAFAQYKSLSDELRECRNGHAMTLITVATPPATTRVLPRGNWQDESGPVVQPAPPQFLPRPPNSGGRLLNRLDLAQWLVSPENPLTARVFVNRLWRQFFGAGLCNTVDDFGAQGEAPSHPELLDWLAVEFRERGWDIKHTIRLMVTSAAYRQDSHLRREVRDVDPQNRLLSSQSPRRLEAEFVRDNALFIAGLLNLEIGGPSAYPYQPAGYYANLQFPDRPYNPDGGPLQYRRGLYAHWQRTFLHPMLANFDAPSREECTANRTISNTPQQALTLLNDPTFVEAARVLAERAILDGGKTDEQKLDFLFETALARPVKAHEKVSLKLFLAAQRDYYHTNPADSTKLTHIGQAPAARGLAEGELAAWASVCRVVLNLHETMTRY